MNINAIKFNSAITTNQNTNNQKQAHYNKTNTLAKDTVSFSSLRLSDEAQEIENAKEQIIDILNDLFADEEPLDICHCEQRSEIKPEHKLKEDLGLDSLDLIDLELQIEYKFFKPNENFNLNVMLDKLPNKDITIQNLAEKLYSLQHPRPKLCTQI